MRVKLITDGSVDVPRDIVEQYDITVVPPIVTIDGKEYLSGVDISSTEFFERQRTAQELPSTSQPSPGQFLDAFEEALKEHDHIFYIGVTSALSGTFNSARQAAMNFPTEAVTLHDSRTLSGAAGMQVIAVARALAAGGDQEAALAAAERTHEETELFFSVDDLTYLIKGGRIGRVAGALGSFLNIRPIIKVDKTEGDFTPVERVRSFKVVLRKLLDHATDVVGEGAAGRFVLLYGEMEEEAEEMKRSLHERFDVKWFRSMVPTPTLLAHTGPRAFGIVAAPGDWPEKGERAQAT